MFRSCLPLTRSHQSENTENATEAQGSTKAKNSAHQKAPTQRKTFSARRDILKVASQAVTCTASPFMISPMLARNSVSSPRNLLPQKSRTGRTQPNRRTAAARRSFTAHAGRRSISADRMFGLSLPSFTPAPSMCRFETFSE